ncbi:methylisocitrate lyase [Nisaea acidiphila]|uniref:Methylisocitrate lyase n=1 Tax=Nisaea acidiphila TaxID=1862145 RepID=A0A9J7AX52_9PROT|nr:methylisocitrate lyase [Nisaea acidiphila]UUX50037.1 methylisocitrate lyase [Nisaea acidiphila]
MTWLLENAALRPAGDRLAALWERPGILRIPGAHDPFSAVVARDTGFETLYLSGGALSASLALPDLGMMTMEELIGQVRGIVRASRLPLVVDGDTGYGEALNVMRLCRELEEAGAAAVQLEDQVLPKKCGHLSDKLLNDTDSMCAKIAAARKARRSLRIIARTDAMASEGLEAAIARAQSYVAAGADAIFPEALTDEGHFRAFAEALDVPLLANMTEFGKTPYYTAEQFEAWGFKMVIWPVTSMRAAAGIVRDLYAHLAEFGGQEGFLDRLMARKDIYKHIGYADYESLDGSIAASVVPEVD